MVDGKLPLNVTSMVEDVLQHQGNRLSDVNLASRKLEQTSLRRYEAGAWLRKMVGVVGGKDLPAQPSEEEFRLGLRSGIILCNVLNKVQAGAVPNVIETPCDTVIIPDGAALSTYQYFENVRNFLVAIEEMGIPTFETSDLEQGGKSSRIVNCVLALKSYSDWKQGGGNGVWRLGGNRKPPSVEKQFVRKHSDLFMSSLSRTSSNGEKSLDGLSSDENLYGDSDLSEGGQPPLLALIRRLLSDKKQEDIPVIVENMLNKAMEELQSRLTIHNEQITASLTDTEELQSSEITEGCYTEKNNRDSEEKQKHMVELEQQQSNIQELKNTLDSTREHMRLLQTNHRKDLNSLGTYLHGLAHSASEYQRVFDENRKLYNQVQDLKGNIRVYCRVRPFLPGQPNRSSTVGNFDDTNITILTPSKYGKEGSKLFSFNKVFGPSASQEDVFADTEPLIRSVLDGYNVCIFAYGQTGSGKTYTMSGPGELTNQSLGVNYRALSDLFLISEQRKDIISYEVSVQMIEIYNEQVRDLLVTDGLSKKLEIRNNSQNGVNVPNAKLVPVTSTSDVVHLMDLGLKNRAVGATAMNSRSSRSHSCLTVHVQGKDLATGTVLRGCMHLVDLAGSERADKSEAAGERLKEAQHINRSLSALGDVISSLAQKQSHVPYRNSKLTQLLQDSLGGQAKTLMFVHISPEHDAIGETLSTLKFAERVSSVELGAARTNKESSEIKDLKEQIASLKAALTEKEEGESGFLQHSISKTPKTVTRVKSFGSSTSQSSCHSIGDISTPEKSNSSSTPRRLSLDNRDFLTNSFPCTPISRPGLMDDEKNVNGDWVDKVMVNRQDGEQVGKWEEDYIHSPEMLTHRYAPNSSSAYQKKSFSAHRRHSLDNGLARTQYPAVTNSDYELEVATSDSLDVDYQRQISIHQSSRISYITEPGVRKPGLTPKHGSETRSLIPPPPSRRALNGINSTLQKPARQSASIDVRRKPAIARI